MELTSTFHSWPRFAYYCPTFVLIEGIYHNHIFMTYMIYIIASLKEEQQKKNYF